MSNCAPSRPSIFPNTRKGASAPLVPCSSRRAAIYPPGSAAPGPVSLKTCIAAVICSIKPSLRSLTLSIFLGAYFQSLSVLCRLDLLNEPVFAWQWAAGYLRIHQSLHLMIPDSDPLEPKPMCGPPAALPSFPSLTRGASAPLAPFSSCRASISLSTRHGRAALIPVMICMHMSIGAVIYYFKPSLRPLALSMFLGATFRPFCSTQTSPALTLPLFAQLWA